MIRIGKENNYHTDSHKRLAEHTVMGSNKVNSSSVINSSSNNTISPLLQHNKKVITCDTVCN